MVPEDEGYMVYCRCHCRSVAPRWSTSRRARPVVQCPICYGDAFSGEPLRLYDGDMEFMTPVSFEVLQVKEVIEQRLPWGREPVALEVGQEGVVA
jgi:hypothetical protein